MQIMHNWLFDWFCSSKKNIDVQDQKSLLQLLKFSEAGKGFIIMDISDPEIQKRAFSQVFVQAQFCQQFFPLKHDTIIVFST